MRNGSNSEFFHVEGEVKLTRMRQSEWRRRWGIAGIVAFDGQVGANADDGRVLDDGYYANNENELYLGDGGSSRTMDVWCRFTNVTIPAGATVVSAYFTVDPAVTTGVGTKSNLYLDDADNPAAPVDQADMAGRARTTAFTAWDDEAFVAGAATDSPDIASVVQEIIDRGGWNSGQAMQLLWDDDGTSGGAQYKITSHDGDSAKAVKLHVEYSA